MMKDITNQTTPPIQHRECKPENHQPRSGYQTTNQSSSQPLTSPVNTTPVVAHNQQFAQPQRQQFQQHQQHQMTIQQYYDQQQGYQQQGRQQQVQPYPQTAQQRYYPQPQARIVTQQPKPGEFVLKTIALHRLGIATIVIGIILVISGIAEVAIFKGYGDNNSGGGIWGGVIIIVAGLFTLASSRQPTNKGINFLDLVAHVVAVIVEAIVLSLVAKDLEYYDNCVYPGFEYSSSRYRYSTNRPYPNLCENKDKKDGGIASYSVQVLLLCVQIAISFTIMYIGCRAFPSCRAFTCLDDCWQDQHSVHQDVCFRNYPTATQQYNDQAITRQNKNQANIQHPESGQQVFANPAAMTTTQQ